MSLDHLCDREPSLWNLAIKLELFVDDHDTTRGVGQ